MQSHVEIIPGPTVASRPRSRVQIFHGAASVHGQTAVPPMAPPVQTQVEVLTPAEAVAARSVPSDPLAQLEAARLRAEQARDDAERRLVMLDAAIADFHQRIAAVSDGEGIPVAADADNTDHPRATESPDANEPSDTAEAVAEASGEET